MFDKLLSQSVSRQGDDSVTSLPRPFPENSGENYFAGDASRVQRLNLLTHLVPYGGVLLILGESGVGKTALLQQIQIKSSDSCRICQLSTAACIDPRQALSEMLDCFAWQADADRSLGGAQLRILREHLGILRRNGYAPVLIIDDADALSDTVFGVLDQLFDGDSSDLLTLVLAGEADLKKRLSGPLLQPLNSHITHELELQPFSAEEQADYIHQHLVWAGIEGVGPFKASALKFIYVASRGVPQRINELARVFWDNKKGSTEAVASVSTWWRLPWLKQLRYVLPLVLISSTAAVFHNEIRTAIFPSPPVSAELAKGPTVALDSQPKKSIEGKRDQASLARTVIAPEAVSSNPRSLQDASAMNANQAAILTTDAGKSASQSGLIPESESKVVPDSAVKDNVVAELAGLNSVADGPVRQTDSELLHQPMPGVAADEVVADSGASDQIAPSISSETGDVTDPLVQQPIQRLAGNQPRNLPSPTLPKPAGTSAAARVVINSMAAAKTSTMTTAEGGRGVSVDSGKRDDDWWLAQSDGQFAVQLLAMEERVVKEYIGRHALKDRVATFRVQGGGQPLLAAALGPYATQAEAGAAAQHWRQQLPGVKPWVRTVASIQQAVADYRRQQQPGWLALVARHEQQLLQQLPQNYAVQLMAMDQKSVTAFVAKHGLLNRVVYFRTRSGGQELYAALLGSFSSRQQALDAGHEIARQAEGVRPWVRSLASVQQVIRTQRDRPR